MKTTLWFIGLTGVALVSNVFAVLSGSGTEASPYLIQSRADFNEFAKPANAALYWASGVHTRLMCHINFANKTIPQIAPTTSKGWYFSGTSFRAVFDGNNMVLSKFKLVQSDSDYVGLFGCIGFGGQVKNLGLESFTIVGNNHVGGMCGENSGTVSDCYARGAVTGKGDRVGGLCGYNKTGTVSGCYATGSVNGTGSDFGGLVGLNGATISGCYATGSVTGTGNYVGGLVGYNHTGTVSACYVTGSVTGTGDYVGGLCGYNNTGTISECYSTGVVTSINGGGLVGQSYSGVIKNSFWDIQTSGRTTSAGGTGLSSAEMKETFYYSVNGWGGEVWTLDAGNDYPRLTWENAGDSFIADPIVSMVGSGSVEDPWVIASKEDFLVVYSGTFFWDKHYLLNTDVDLAGITYSRGLLGYDKGNSFTGSFEGNGYIIRNLTIEGGANLGLFGYLDQEALITNLCVENVSVTGTGYYVGGLCGYNNTGTISECYSTGAVTGGYAGGLCGYNNTGTISECYSTNAVTGSYAGGLCGYNNTGTISECYSTGVVTSINGGGLVGQSYSGVIKNSFWDIQTSGRTTSAGGTGLSSAEMKETFYYSVNGWGGEVWTLDAGNDYPRLTWENAGDSFIADPIVSMVGSGSVEDPWVIASKEDFLVVYSGTFFWDKHYLLNTDVDLAGITYSRGLLGYDKGNSFTGSFEGNGYIIRNLTIEGGANLGLFGYLDQEALITNLCVENVSVTGTGYYVGGLCGYNNTGTISECYSTGAVTGGYAGGLCGYNNTGTISECYSTNAVTGSYAGGLCGYNNTGTISECYSTGVVTSINGGGLVGQSYSGVIKNSFWDIQTSGRTTSAGGTGLSSAEMKETFYYSVNGWGGEVWTLDAGNDYPRLTWENAGDSFIADPIVSMVGSGSVEDPWVIASKEDFLVVYSGTFFWDKHYLLNTDVDLAGITYSRGLLGYDKGNSFTGSFEGNGYIIRNLTIEGGANLGLFGYLDQEALITNLCVENVSVTGTGYYVGGLCGYNNTGTVSGCYVTGSVTGTGYYVGGLVGCNSGTLSQSYATNAVTGSYAGGLCGYNNTGTISECYSTGVVTSSNGGGLVGQSSSGVIKNSFWDIQTSGRTTSAGGTGKTIAKMKDINTFLSVGWDFVDETVNGTEDIWRMITNNYPIHSWTEGFTLNVAELVIEEGQTVMFEVVLPDAPTAEVAINLSISGDGDIELLTATTLVFNVGNWHIPQIVNVRAKFDNNYYNDKATLILKSRGYHAEIPLQEIDIQPDPSYEIIVVSNEDVIVHKGSQASFTVMLGEDPLVPVQMNLNITGDPDITIGSATVLYFNSSNYAIPQTVTVKSRLDAGKEDTQAELLLSSPNLPERLFKNITINELARKPFRLSKPPVWLEAVEVLHATSSSAEISGLFTNPSDATWHTFRVASIPGVPAVPRIPGKYVNEYHFVGIWGGNYTWKVVKVWVPGTPGKPAIPAKNRASIIFTSNQSQKTGAVWVAIYQQVDSRYKLVSARGFKQGKSFKFKFIKKADVDYYVRITPAFSDLGSYSINVTTAAIR